MQFKPKKAHGSQKQHEQMYRYALDNNVSEVLRCVGNGCDIDYNGEAVLEVALVYGYSKLLRVCLKLSKCTTLASRAHLLKDGNSVLKKQVKAKLASMGQEV